MSKVIIDYDKCDGADCGECADVCPMEILIIDDNDEIAIQHPEECSYCEVCMDVCPNACIKIEDED
ncbi:4Fe-4S binding protein [Methanobrevibacter sp. OttesenSCG-928-K11]|nr:4Fe-4S binding protein [Methanobrevibacter sp. OttesenSCG-928-K11]MDL2270744.1 4Fe-4S binding protein [Methanobrevibacter sp. OttesenSCG-928-I08]